MWDGLGPVGQKETNSTRDGSRKLMCLVEHLRTQAAPTPDLGQREQGLPPMEGASSWQVV